MPVPRPELDMNLTVIGVGGCGKTLLKSLCSHDWFLKHYLSGNDRRLKLYTLDTARNERDDDNTFMNDLTRHVETIRSDCAQNIAATGTVDCRHFDLTSMARIERIPDLVSQHVVDRIQRYDVRNPVWWLHDPKNNIYFDDLTRFDGNLTCGFDGGVYRMRAVSKAAFTIAYNDQPNQFTGIVDNIAGTTAIIVGLGGGTGSGMFIDLAQKIREQNPNRNIYLFAMLPSSVEGNNEQLNAAVALTELEYLNVTDTTRRRVFDHIIITPLERTGFRRIEESRDAPDVKDFSDAFPYLFVNTFAISHDNVVLNNQLKYGGFVNADSHVIEYPIDKILMFQREYDSYLTKLVDITDIRQSICDAVVTFFDRHETNDNVCQNNGLPNEPDNIEDVRKYRDAVNWVKMLWSGVGARHLGLNTPDEIVDILDQRLPIRDLNRLNFDELREYVSTIKRQMNNIGARAETWRERDRILFNCIKDNLDILEKIGEYYIKTTCLIEPTSNIAHMSVMSFDPPNLVEDRRASIKRRITELSNDNTNLQRAKNGYDSNYKNLQTDLDNLNSQITKINNDPGAISNDIGDLQIKIQNITDTKTLKRNDVNKAISGISVFIQEYCEQEANRDRWETFEKKYIEHINDICDRYPSMVNKASTGARPRLSDWNKRHDQFPLMTNEFDPYSRNDRETNFVDILRRLDADITDYYAGKYYSIAAARSLLHRGDAARYEELEKRRYERIGRTIEESNNNYNTFFSRVMEEPIVHINENSIINVFNTTSDTIIEHIISPLIDEFEIDEYRDKLISIIKDSRSGGFANIRSVLNTEINSILDEKYHWSEDMDRHNQSVSQKKDEQITQIQNKIATVNLDIQQNRDKISEVDTKISVNNSKIKYLYDVLNDLIDGTNDVRERYNNLSPMGLTEPVVAGLGDNTRRSYKSTFGQPSLEILQGLGDNSTLDILTNSGDAGTTDAMGLINILKQDYTDLLDSGMLGIRSLFIQSIEDRGINWSPEASGFAITTQADCIYNCLTERNNNTGRSLEGIMQETIMRSVHSWNNNNNNNDHITIHNGAKPWECSITLMVAGNYLENISGFQRAGVYRLAYERGKDNFLHHVLGLERGAYITRDLAEDQVAMKNAVDEKRGIPTIINTILGLYNDDKKLTDAIANIKNAQDSI